MNPRPRAYEFVRNHTLSHAHSLFGPVAADVAQTSALSRQEQRDEKLVLIGMKEQFKIGEYRNPSGKIVYRVYGKRANGQIVRQNFKIYQLALARRQELEIEILNLPQLVMRPTRLSADQVAEAEAAFYRLHGTNHGLVACVEHFLKTWKPAFIERDLAVALQEFLETKRAQNLRQDSLSSLRVRVNRLALLHKHKMLSQITPDDIRAAVNNPHWSPVTRNNERRSFHCFFQWAVDQKYCEANPVAKIKPAKIERGEPKVMSLAEVKSFLRAALDFKEGRMLPFVVLNLFAGVRPTELRRISWDDIDLEAKTMTIRSAAAKLRQRRLVELSDNLVTWLMPYRGRPIFEKSFRRDFDAVRRAAGFRGSVGRNEIDETRKPWINDLFRHTSLSFHLAAHKNEGETADWGGTSVVMLHQHYRGIVRPADAELFWRLLPDNLDAQVISLPQAA